jgi:hypothetical protein
MHTYIQLVTWRCVGLQAGDAVRVHMDIFGHHWSRACSRGLGRMGGRRMRSLRGPVRAVVRDALLLYTYIHILTYTHTYIHTHIPCASGGSAWWRRSAWERRGLKSDPYIHTYIHTYIHIRLHTYTIACMRSQVRTWGSCWAARWWGSWHPRTACPTPQGSPSNRPTHHTTGMYVCMYVCMFLGI